MGQDVAAFYRHSSGTLVVLNLEFRISNLESGLIEVEIAGRPFDGLILAFFQGFFELSFQ